MEGGSSRKKERNGCSRKKENNARPQAVRSGKDRGSDKSDILVRVISSRDRKERGRKSENRFSTQRFSAREGPPRAQAARAQGKGRALNLGRLPTTSTIV